MLQFARLAPGGGWRRARGAPLAPHAARPPVCGWQGVDSRSPLQALVHRRQWSRAVVSKSTSEKELVTRDPQPLQEPEPGAADGEKGQQSPGERESWLSKLNLFKLIRKQMEQPEGASPRQPLPRRLRLYLAVLGLAVVGLVARMMAGPSLKPITHEVLYSDFVRLVDHKAVVAARLDSTSGRLFFEPRPDLVQIMAPGTSSGRPTSAAPAAQLPWAPEWLVGGAGTGMAAPAAATSPRTSSSSSGQAASAQASAASGQQQGALQLAPAQAGTRVSRRFFITLPGKNDEPLLSRMLAAGVEFAVVKASMQSVLMNVLLTTLALWLPLLPLLFVVRRLLDSRTGGAGGKRKAPGPAAPRVTFADVAGVEGAKEELAEVVECLRNSKRYSRLAAKMPSGVLLSGPPGTGKTLLAKAVAGEAGVPFLSTSASEFVELFVGRGAARIRELFAEARKVAPCVVFIDELDAVGGRRGAGFNDERDQTLNQLLTELDGFDGRPGVLLLAATNRADALDPALLRPGRLSRRVVVPVPDEAGRAQILAVHMRAVPLEGGPEGKAEACARLAKLSSGFSGAELANVVNEGALLAARRGKELVGMRELIEGVRRTKFGVNGGVGSQNGAGGSGVGAQFQNWLLDLLYPLGPASANAGPPSSKVAKASTS